MFPQLTVVLLMISSMTLCECKDLGSAMAHISNSGIGVLTKVEKSTAAVDINPFTAIGHKVERVANIGKITKPFVIGAAIPAASAATGAVVGAALATPVVVKAVAFPAVVAAKTAVVMAAVPAAVELAHSKLETAANKLVSKSKKVVKKAKVGALIGVKLLKAKAIGAAVKTAAAVKAGQVLLVKATVRAGKLILKPIAVVTGSKLKFLGGALGLFGKGVKLTGAALTKAGTGLKLGGLGGIGLGATAIHWGLDTTSVSKQVNDDFDSIKHYLPLFNVLKKFKH